MRTLIRAWNSLFFDLQVCVASSFHVHWSCESWNEADDAVYIFSIATMHHYILNLRWKPAHARRRLLSKRRTWLALGAMLIEEFTQAADYINSHSCVWMVFVSFECSKTFLCAMIACFRTDLKAETFSVLYVYIYIYIYMKSLSNCSRFVRPCFIEFVVTRLFVRICLDWSDVLHMCMWGACVMCHRSELKA